MNNGDGGMTLIQMLINKIVDNCKSYYEEEHNCKSKIKAESTEMEKNEMALISKRTAP